MREIWAFEPFGTQPRLHMRALNNAEQEIQATDDVSMTLCERWVLRWLASYGHDRFVPHASRALYLPEERAVLGEAGDESCS